MVQSSHKKRMDQSTTTQQVLHGGDPVVSTLLHKNLEPTPVKWAELNFTESPKLLH